MKLIVRDLRTALGPFVSAALPVFVAAAIVGTIPSVSNAENPADAIARIRQGSYAQMPPPQTAYASGPAGKGMTIENGTGSLLRVHFSGPANRTVDVPNGQSADMELVVGSYEVAAEVPGTSIMLFYGTQTYQPNTHYWLKFFMETRYR